MAKKWRKKLKKEIKRSRSLKLDEDLRMIKKAIDKNKRLWVGNIHCRNKGDDSLRYKLYKRLLRCGIAYKIVDGEEYAFYPIKEYKKRKLQLHQIGRAIW